MTTFIELVRKFKYLVIRPKVDLDLGTEISFHLASRADELQKQGLSPADSLLQARREFGSISRLKEESRAAWQFWWLEELSRSLSYAIRSFRRNPAFTWTAVFCLALGVGANATIFSLTMEALFSVPSCAHPNSTAYVRIGGNSHSPLAVWRFLHDAHLFAQIAGAQELAEANWREGENTYHLWEARVTDNFFTGLGVPVLIGRPLTKGTPDGAIISYGLWRGKLLGRTNILGRKLILDGRLYRIAGVLPPHHKTMTGLGLSPDVYVTATRADDIVSLYAQIPSGMSMREAGIRLKLVCKQLDKAVPRPGLESWATNVEVSGVTGIDRLESLGFLPIAGFFAVLMIVVLLLLVIACSNVVGLLLARASARQHELAVRVSLGASRLRIAVHLFAESFLLALLGSAAGLLLELALTKVLNTIELPLPVPLRLSIQPDFRLAAYLIGVALVITVMVGLAPALAAARSSVVAGLKSEEHQVGRAWWTLRSLLVVGQISASTILLITAALFARNLTQAVSMNPGFDLDHTNWSSMRLVPERYASTDPKSPARIRALTMAALKQIAELPGVESTASVRAVPLNDNITEETGIRVDNTGDEIQLQFSFNRVSPGYFHTIGIPLVAGNEFLPTQQGNVPTVVILNENMARRVFGSGNPVGHVIRLSNRQPLTVVGVAKNSKYFTLAEHEKLALYQSVLQSDWAVVNLNFLVRSFAPPDSIIKDVNKVLGRIDPTAAIQTRPLRKALGIALLPSYAGAAITGSIGLLGMALAAIGLYGLILYTVSRRTREIGLRLALGATRQAVISMVLRQTLLLAGLGLCAGLAVSLFATRPLVIFLVPGIKSYDPISYGVVTLVLLLVAGLAALSPLVKACSIEPMKALRYE